MPKGDKPTLKQKRFIATYSGNGVEAARKAGYKGNDKTLSVIANENLAKPYIRDAIKKREEKELQPLIANRQARQKFWTDIMNSKSRSVRLSDKLRASELLGKSEADFTEKVEQSGPKGGPLVVAYIPPNGKEAPEFPLPTSLPEAASEK